jgi:glutamate racemase
MDNRPVGVFDSGLGGLTAVKRLIEILPCEDIIYFGDTGRVPYGTHSGDTIKKYAKSAMKFLIGENIKRVLIACGTVSSVALPYLKSVFEIPMDGVVEAAVEKAVKVTRNKKIGIIGTNATIRSGVYEKMLKQANGNIRTVPSGAAQAMSTGEIRTISAACPLFVPLVENCRTSKNDIVVQTIVEEYLKPVKEYGADTLILGCTHYPLLQDAIASFMGGGVYLVNPGAEGAYKIKEELAKSGALCEPAKKRRLSFFVTDDADDFRANAERYLEMPLEGSVREIDIEKY